MTGILTLFVLLLISALFLLQIIIFMFTLGTSKSHVRIWGTMDKWNLSWLDGKCKTKYISVSYYNLSLHCGRSTCFHCKQMGNNSISIILSFLVKGNTIGYQYCFGNSIKMFFSHYLQKDASSALAHSGAHLDLSAFSSPEVSG